MKDTSGAQVLGRTSLKRLGMVMVPTLAVAGVLGVMMANGAIAMSLAISGQTAQMTVGELSGTGFAQYGGVDQESNGTPVAVAVSSFTSATISNGLCQSVTTDLSKLTGGLLGNYTLTLKASGATASSLVIDLQTLNATEADFSGMNIGTDAGASGGAPGLFAQTATSADLKNVQQVSNATTAGSFDLQNMSLSIAPGTTGCIQ
ncbi:hypothetical protein KDL01_14570 [Actinospica durhamensis]|uniref:Cholesterol esterase n=1 Tax=Actinospica durhamensis TaxID=1508375 RepID=A0A941ENH9_9ACTN|nr:DUF6230 family protein [Actinospica durhamensis]MBR7834496.1 hypothetical protein [Actinospica durhamensis]